MQAGRRPAKSRRAVAEVIAEILLVVLVVTLTGILIAFYAPLIPSSFPRPIATSVGLGPATGGGDLFAIPVAYASGAPPLQQLQVYIHGPNGFGVDNSSWTAALWAANGAILGHYQPSEGWSASTSLAHILSTGDRFVVQFVAPLTGNGYVFGLAGTGDWGGLVSVPLP